ncbi:MAG: ATP-grasp domain-containing protein [Bacteriovorax sp.]|nr:ATP-grasp domain-containing protein [Bacteriovorax sp.]
MGKNSIIIASLNPELYSTKRLLEEALKLKRSPIYLNPYQHQLTQQKVKISGTYFHRTTGTNYDDFDLVVSKHHELHGMKVTNPVECLKTFRSKDLQSLFFTEHALPSIKTLLYRGDLNAKVESEISKLGRDNKFILKMNRGNQGIGVNYIEGVKSLHSVLETFYAMKDQRFLIQPYITHKKEWRLFIVKGEIIACIEKTLNKEDFRGNAKRSSGKLLKKISDELKAIALNAFNFSGLDYAGLDLLQSDQGEILILEINPIPGFEQAEELSGKNIARELLTLL